MQIPASDNSGHTRRTERNRLEVPVLRLPESEASEDAQPEHSVPEQALEPVMVPPLERVPELALLQEQEQRRAPRPELVQVSEPELVQPLVQVHAVLPLSPSSLQRTCSVHEHNTVRACSARFLV